MNKNNIKSRRGKSSAGFTLIEALIYITIVSGVLIMASVFAWDVIGGKTKSQSTQEVGANSRVIMDRLVKEIRQAKDINTGSSFGVNLALPANAGRKLSLATKDTTTNPTEFSVANNVLTIRQGATGIAYALSSNQVKISDLTFQNLSTASDKTKNIKINLIIEHLNPQSRQEYGATDSLETTVELRDR